MHGGIPDRLFHYTTEGGLQGILKSQSLRPSLIALNPADARYGDGQYFSDIRPGTKSLIELSRAFLGFPFQGRRFTHFVEVDLTGLDVVSGRGGVFVVLNSGPHCQLRQCAVKENAVHYVAVEWVHTFPDEPVFLYYELDEGRYEHRKVEEYRDGTVHSADATHEQGSTFLAWEPHPTQQEIAADPQFQVSEITAQEFERIWSRATARALEPVAGH